MRRLVTMVLASAALVGSLVATDAQARGAGGGGRIGGFAGARIGGYGGGRIGAFAGGRIGGYGEGRIGGFAGEHIGAFTGGRIGVLTGGRIGVLAGGRAGGYGGSRIGGFAGEHIAAFPGGRIGGYGGARIAGIHPGIHQVYFGYGNRVGYGRRALVEYARGDLVRGTLSGSGLPASTAVSSRPQMRMTPPLSSSTDGAGGIGSAAAESSAAIFGPASLDQPAASRILTNSTGLACPSYTSSSVPYNCTYGGQTNTSATQSAP
jgi:hypothetical protein